MEILIFLKHAFSLVKEKGYKIQNIDGTIILQEPHVSKFIPKMIDMPDTWLDNRLEILTKSNTLHISQAN